MINIWDFQDADYVRIVDIDENIFEGSAIELSDIEDKTDLEVQEDSITIYTQGQYIQFNQSEIKSIEETSKPS